MVDWRTTKNSTLLWFADEEEVFVGLFHQIMFTGIFLQLPLICVKCFLLFLEFGDFGSIEIRLSLQGPDFLTQPILIQEVIGVKKCKPRHQGEKDQEVLVADQLTEHGSKVGVRVHFAG